MQNHFRFCSCPAALVHHTHPKDGLMSRRRTEQPSSHLTKPSGFYFLGKKLPVMATAWAILFTSGREVPSLCILPPRARSVPAFLSVLGARAAERPGYHILEEIKEGN